MWLAGPNPGNVLATFQASEGNFAICGGNNRLSSLDLPGTKNSLESDIEDFKIYPNPVESDFTVEYKAIQNEVVTFQIFDIEGRSIYTAEFENPKTGFYTKRFNDLDLTKGMYFFNIQSNNFKKMLKVTKL